MRTENFWEVSGSQTAEETFFGIGSHSMLNHRDGALATRFGPTGGLASGSSQIDFILCDLRPGIRCVGFHNDERATIAKPTDHAMIAAHFDIETMQKPGRRTAATKKTHIVGNISDPLRELVNTAGR